MSNRDLVLYVDVEGYKGFHLTTYNDIQDDVLSVYLKDLYLQFKCNFEDLLRARASGSILDCTKLERLN